MNHFTNHNVLSDRQHGFRARRSCESQLLSLTHELHEHLEKKSQIDLIVLDFSKAFDKVPHQRLMGKICNQGIQGTTHRWINAFLTDRLKRVIVLSYSFPSSMIYHWQCQVVVSVSSRMIVSFIAQFLLRLIVKLSKPISLILKHGSESGVCLLILINAT